MWRLSETVRLVRHRQIHPAQSSVMQQGEFRWWTLLHRNGEVSTFISHADREISIISCTVRFSHIDILWQKACMLSLSELET